ncbi:hypothetical protein D9M71_482010 [compost metagenome]
MHRQGTFSRVFAPIERVTVRTTLALRIEVDAPHLISKGIHQLADLCRIGAEDAQLLPEVRLQHIVDYGLQIAVRHHRHNRPELFFLIDPHRRSDRVEHRWVEEGLPRLASTRIDHLSAFGHRIGH